MEDVTRKFTALDSKAEMREILSSVYNSLMVKGYNPINQIVGYILSEDPTYITNYNNARTLICRLDRDELLQADWIKIAVLIGQNIGFVRLRFYYTHFKLCCWQSFFASIIGGTCNFEKHCLFFTYLTTKFI